MEYQPLEPATYRALAQAGLQSEWQRLCQAVESALTRDRHYPNECSARKVHHALLDLRQYVSDNPKAIHKRLVRLIDSDVQMSLFVIVYR